MLIQKNEPQIPSPPLKKMPMISQVLDEQSNTTSSWPGGHVRGMFRRLLARVRGASLCGLEVIGVLVSGRLDGEMFETCFFSLMNFVLFGSFRFLGLAETT